MHQRPPGTAGRVGVAARWAAGAKAVVPALWQTRHREPLLWARTGALGVGPRATHLTRQQTWHWGDSWRTRGMHLPSPLPGSERRTKLSCDCHPVVPQAASHCSNQIARHPALPLTPQGKTPAKAPEPGQFPTLHADGAAGSRQARGQAT